MGNSTVSILIVTDRPADLQSLRALLNPLGERVLAAESAEEALSLAHREDLAAAIIDLPLPCADGFLLVQALRSLAQCAKLPVLFVCTEPPDSDTCRHIYELGAADLIAPPVDPEALRSRVAIFAELHRQRTRLEDFCYTVAHDLRAPLRSIHGYAELIGEHLGLQQFNQDRAYLERIKTSATRLDQLIQDLLSYSRVALVGLDLEPVDLKLVVATAVAELQDEIDRKRASVEICEPLPVVRGERAILEQVVMNLLANGIKFSKDRELPHVEVFAESRDGQVRLTVCDHGIGIAPPYLDRIFRAFERVQSSRHYPGTGMGLAIVARAMDRLGGRYGVKSVPGQGSEFWIELKAATAPPRP